MSEPPLTAHALADAAVEFVIDQLEQLIAAHLPDLRLPYVFAGHAVGADVRADLAFTMGLLRSAGVGHIASIPIDDALDTVLTPVDGARTHTFYSYRVAETLLRLGRAPKDLAPNLIEACDSTSAIPGLDNGTLPRNYAAVLARCEVARAAIGLIASDDPVLVDLIDRTAALLGTNPAGHLDDSRSDIARYDIYTADIRLFTEPFAERLGDVWLSGSRHAVNVVERVSATNGAGITWGRSIGALAVCLTLEYAGLVARHDLDADRARWTALGARALHRLGGWFSGGVINAHQYRSTYGYRGPFRRLQMTLDCLGKVVDAALALRDGPDIAVETRTLDPDRDELLIFDADRRAGVWTYRTRDLAFVVPLVGASLADYLPGPRNPGLFDVPVDSPLPVGVPFVLHKGKTFVTNGPPATVEHLSNGLGTTHEGFVVSGLMEIPPDAATMAGTRAAEYRVEGRTLHVDEVLTFPHDVPTAVAFQLAEAADRPLYVVLSADEPAAVATTIDTAGIKEWRSFWSELPVVHQIEMAGAPSVRISWSVTPKLRVLSPSYDHHYHRTLYDATGPTVVDARFPMGRLNDRAALHAMLDRTDIFHLHWPEWFLGNDLPRNKRFIAELQEAGVRIVWTQHNLEPHTRDERMEPVYEAWAAAADGVLHHSDWGRGVASDRYAFRADAHHALVPHPHFGNFGAHRDPDRRRGLETELGLRHGVLRLGIVGAPRPGKDIESVMRAVHRSTRQDIELLVLSLEGHEEVPDDPRVRAQRYQMIDRALYDQGLGLIDVLVLPFTPGEMLTTGTVGDAVAHGIPALTTPWGYVLETLGDAAIVYGGSEDDLLEAIESLDAQVIAESGRASRALRDRYAPEAVARVLRAALEAVGTTRL